MTRFTLAALFLLGCFSVGFAGDPFVGIPYTNDELIELNRQIRDGELDDEDIDAIIPRLILSCRPDATESMSLHALSTLYERKPEIVRPHLPSFARLIGVARRQQEIYDLCSFFLRIGEFPPDVVASLDQKFAARDEDDFFANGKMAAILLKTSPENEDVRTWLEQQLNHDSHYHRVAALNALFYAGTAAKPSLPIVKLRLLDESAAVRVAAARLVWQTGDDADTAYDVLMDSLDDEPEGYHTGPIYVSAWSPDHHYVAISLLGVIKRHHHEVAQRMILFLNDEEIPLQIVTLRALATLNHRSPEVLAAVREKLNDKHGVAAEAEATLRKLTADDE